MAMTSYYSQEQGFLMRKQHEIIDVEMYRNRAMQNISPYHSEHEAIKPQEQQENKILLLL